MSEVEARQRQELEAAAAVIAGLKAELAARTEEAKWNAGRVEELQATVRSLEARRLRSRG